MDLLGCGHAASAGGSRMCVHLLRQTRPPACRVLTGHGMQYDLACAECADGDRLDGLVAACEGCVDSGESWSDPGGWRGTPEILIQDAEVPGIWTRAPAAVQPAGNRCLAALPGGWLVLTDTGLVSIVHGVVQQLGPVVMPPEPDAEPYLGRMPGPALYTSQDGRFAAVVTDYGRYGSVIDLARGAVVLSLDRDDYHNQTTPFPFAFRGLGSQTTVIAATAWNRLDRFDAATGRLLSERNLHWEKGGERPDDYLDYFHGRLSLSPLGQWLIDDGWVWHPVGIPYLVDAEQWEAGGTYASEHGRDLSLRSYSWDQPIAWIDADTVAIQRIGADDEAMIDGVEIYSAISGRRIGMMAGPSGPMWGYEGRLYVAAEQGLEAWDPAIGARVGLLGGFTPAAFDPATGTFAQLDEGTLRAWSPATSG